MEENFAGLGNAGLSLCSKALANSRDSVQAWDMLKKEPLPIASVRVPAKRVKTLEAEKAMTLAEDILENGQLTPIRVREDSKGYVLIEGLHRLEAMKLLGEETIEGYKVHARLH
ncbi:ParB N-terminal domain-containing protein [Aliiroseovarius sp. S1123]|nr:ParB N-terminal domain-containing protein [Aliiroseovarius sp. S1123]